MGMGQYPGDAYPGLSTCEVMYLLGFMSGLAGGTGSRFWAAVLRLDGHFRGHRQVWPCIGFCIEQRL